MYTRGRLTFHTNSLRQTLNSLEPEAASFERTELAALDAQVAALKQVNELLSRELWDLRQDRNYWREAHLAAQRIAAANEPKVPERKLPPIVPPATHKHRRRFWNLGRRSR